MVYLETSWDDGLKNDYRIVELLNSYGIGGTFYITSVGSSEFMLSPNYSEFFDRGDLRRLRNMGFTIGGHTHTHPPDLKLLSQQQLENELILNKDWIEQSIGEKITKFCPPRGRHNPKVIDTIQKVGYTQNRVTLVLSVEYPVDKMRVSTTVQVHPHRKEYNNKNWLKLAESKFEEACKLEKGYFHVWGHSQELDRFNLWEGFESLLRFLERNKDKWTYAENL